LTQPTDPATAEALLRSAPKIDLHCHLIGCVRSGTFGELAKKHDFDLPMPAHELYPRINSDPMPEELEHGPWFNLLRIYEDICAVLKDADDFARVVYEAMEDGLKINNTRYHEFAFSPSVHLEHGVAYQTMADGLIAGIQAATTDFGVRATVIAAVDREDTGDVARAMVEEVVAYPKSEIRAVGLDFEETAGPPERFIDAFVLAKRHGLHRTAHAAEHDPWARNITTCLDALCCERLDHGYHVMADHRVMARCRDEGIPFNVIPSTSRRATRAWRLGRIREMIASGLFITINSDDPALFRFCLNQEYLLASSEDGLALSTDQLLDMSARAIEASFLDHVERASYAHEFAEWRRSYAPSGPATQESRGAKVPS
jgi:adenosine deaminase